MTNILEFRRSGRAELSPERRRSHNEGEFGSVVIFPGVRYEFLDDPEPDAKSEKNKFSVRGPKPKAG